MNAKKCKALRREARERTVGMPDRNYVQANIRDADGLAVRGTVCHDVQSTAYAYKALKAAARGFTLIELMIVVAIVAILAAVGLPAYQDYTTRAKVSEIVLAASACKTSLVEYYQSQAKWPDSQKDSGCTEQRTKYVDSLDVGKGGLIIVTAKTGPDALDPKAGGQLVLEPTVSDTGHIMWTCNGDQTTIPKRYLPAYCR